MATTLLRGETAAVQVAFRRDLIFPAAPKWTLYDWEDAPMQRGTAQQTDSGWAAQITIPAGLDIPEGAQTLLIEFTVSDATGREHTLTREVEVVDGLNEHRPYGLIWWSNSTAVSDSVLLSKVAKKITVSLREGYGAGKVLASNVLTEPEAVSTTARGALYEVGVTGLKFTNAVSGSYYPYQFVIEAEYERGAPDIVVKPVYGLSPLIVSKLNTLKRYLDKGQFTDIDPNLTWSDEELIHYLVEGVQYLNAQPPEMSFWTVESLPGPLDSLASMAAAWVALNARYIAEGFSSFDFQSGGVNLSWDRRPVIETKMNELKGTLDTILQQSKRAALKTFGPGDPPPGTKLARNRVGMGGVNLGPMTNDSLRPGAGFGLFGAYAGRRYLG